MNECITKALLFAECNLLTICGIRCSNIVIAISLESVLLLGSQLHSLHSRLLIFFTVVLQFKNK